MRPATSRDVSQNSAHHAHQQDFLPSSDPWELRPIHDIVHWTSGAFQTTLPHVVHPNPFWSLIFARAIASVQIGGLARCQASPSDLSVDFSVTLERPKRMGYTVSFGSGAGYVNASPLLAAWRLCMNRSRSSFVSLIVPPTTSASPLPRLQRSAQGQLTYA